MSIIYSLSEIIDWARTHSPFYRDLYRHLPPTPTLALSDLPIVDQGQFWQHNQREKNTLLTGPMHEGICFKSGGTTGHPKFSLYTLEEWETFTAEFGQGMRHLAFSPGDRVANLFYAGNLYASFLFITKSLEKSQLPLLQFPLTGQMTTPEIVKLLQEWQINCLLGVPTSLLAILEYCLHHHIALPLKKIFYGGESMYADQRSWIRRFYPDLHISSIGYASVDGGHLGYASPECQDNEHFCFSASSIMEIIDEETGKPIDSPHRPGKLVYTNLTRKLMPIIRYPVGDRAHWIEPGRHYKILGRSEEGARLGTVTLNRDDLMDIFKPFEHLQILQVQFHLQRRENKDELIIKLGVGVSEQRSVDQLNDLTAAIYAARPALKEEADKGRVHPVILQWAHPEELQTNPRTGKMLIVVDKRNEEMKK